MIHLYSDGFILRLWNTSWILHRRRAYAFPFTFLFFSLGDFVLEKSGLARVVVWALRCQFSQDQILSRFVGKAVLTCKLSSKAIALQYATDDSSLLAECTEESLAFRGCSGCQQVFHLHLPGVSTLCLSLDSQTIADANMTLKKE